MWDEAERLVDDSLTFDNLSRLKQLQRTGDEGHDLRADFGYNAAGQLDSIDRYSNLAGTSLIVSSGYVYDGVGRLKELNHTHNSTNIARYRYTYDKAGRITEFDNLDHTGENADLTYDRTSQLLAADRSSDDESYAYDAAGNRTSKGGTSQTIDSNNQLLRDGTYEYQYDDEGNRTKRITRVSGQATGATTEYVWDYRNRLEQVLQRPSPTGTISKKITYRYDMFDHLTRRIEDPDGDLGSASTFNREYMWNGDELVASLLTHSTDASKLQIYAYGPEPDLVLFEEDTYSGSLHTLLGDHQNTVRDVVSTSGTVENHLVYSTYGEVTSETSNGYSPLMKYTGKPLDVTTGLQYNLHRWYDAAVGRWISEDPIGFGGSDANLCRYAFNSPVSHVDPSGTFAVIQVSVTVFGFRIPLGRIDLTPPPAVVIPTKPKIPDGFWNSLEQSVTSIGEGAGAIGAWLAGDPVTAEQHAEEAAKTSPYHQVDDAPGYQTGVAIALGTSAVATAGAIATGAGKLFFFENEPILVEGTLVGGRVGSGGLFQIRPTGGGPWFRIDIHSFPIVGGPKGAGAIFRGPPLPHIDIPILGVQHFPWWPPFNL